MPITINEGGTLKTLTSVTSNEGGTLYPLNTIYANENGTLYTIFSLATTTKPTSLTWTPTDNSATISMGTDGLSGTIRNGSHGATVSSNIFAAPSGCVYTIKLTSMELANTSYMGGGTIQLMSANQGDDTAEAVCSVGVHTETSSSNSYNATAVLESGKDYWIIVEGGGGGQSGTCGIVATFTITFT